MMMGLIVITVVFVIIGSIVQRRLKKRFKEYSKIQISSGLSGKEVAEKMLRDNNIQDVEVISVEGKLTDHYDPSKRTINLSKDVFEGRHVAAAAVAAHETGHALQHAMAYGFLEFRSALVPIVNFSGKLMNIVIWGMILGGFIFALFPYDTVLLTIIIAQAVITTFSVVTLPVEIDASKRALVWLNTSGITVGEEHEKAANALKWAASTYVVAALAAVASLLYWVMLFAGGRD